MFVHRLAVPLLVLITGAAIIFVLAGFATHRLVVRTDRYEAGLAEKVSVSRNTSTYQPKLAVNVPLKGGGGGAGPQIARSARLDLYVDSVGKAIAAATGLTHRSGGDVFSLNASDERADDANATMQVRVPAARFDTAMNAFSDLGTVRSRSVAAEDLTTDVTDDGARLRNLRQTEADILTIMKRSGRVSEVMDAETQLSAVREQIETLESERKEMRGRIAYATIDLTLEAQTGNAPAEPTPLSQIATATREASHAFAQSIVSLVAVAIWVLIFTPYALALLVIALLVRRRAPGPTR